MSKASKSANARPLLVLIDGSHALFRAYFAVRHLSSPTGQPTGAVYGLVSMLLKLQRDHAPAGIAVCFDAAGPTFRHDLEASYKAHRPDMPEDLAAQWPVAQRVTEELGLPLLAIPGLEADDLIATLATRGRLAGFDVLIVSGDKDLMQLVADADDGHGRTRQLDDGKNVVYDQAGVKQRWGVGPELIGDLLAIMGDSSDNIPGVRGIGEKGAVKLLAQWGTLDNIYAHLDEVEPPRIRELLREGESSARLARQLVALHCDADVKLVVTELAAREPNLPALQKSFAELGFKRLLKEYMGEVAQPAQAFAFETVTDLADVAGIAEQIRSTRRVALCAVTSQADPDRVMPMWGDLVGLGLAWGANRAAYIPLGHRHGDALVAGQPPLDAVLAALRPVLENAAIAKIGHHAKYDALVLRRHGVQVHGWTADPMLASYLHEPERFAHTLRNIAASHLGVTLPGDDELLGKGKSQAGWHAVAIEKASEHVALRASLTLRCADALLPHLKEVGLDRLYSELEVPLEGVLAEMEFAGIRVDLAELQAQSAWLAGEIAAEEHAIHELAGGPFSIGSPQQLSEVLFTRLALPAKKRTQTGFSTDQTVLEGLADQHPIAAKVLRWRQLSKLKSTYTDSLPSQILPLTGRVHTCYQQAVAATGRLSSTEPNLQNIPIRSVEGKRIRQAFVADPGCVLLSADYSQIELRVMAHLADDPGLQDAFRRGADIHRETAAKMFGVFPGMVTTAQRNAAKTINFGILYGMGAQRLAREIDVSQKEAKAFIDKYFEGFPGVRAFVERTEAQARETGEVRTLYGRRRLVPGMSSQNAMERSAAERVAVNTPVQGTAADLIKYAMLEVQRRLTQEKLKARLLLQVHDELVLEVPHGEVEVVTELVKAAMQGVAQLAVPLSVEVGSGANWASAH